MSISFAKYLQPQEQPKSTLYYLTENPLVKGLSTVGRGIGTAGKTVFSPFTRAAATGQAALRGGGALISAGIAGAVGEEEMAGRILYRERAAQIAEMQRSRELRPVRTVRESIGVGTQMGTTLFAPGASFGAGGVGMGAVTGGISGLIYGSGTGLETAGMKDLSATETATEVRNQALIGLASGVITGAAAGWIGSKWKGKQAAVDVEAGIEERAKTELQETLTEKTTGKVDDTFQPTVDDALNSGLTLRDTDLIVGADNDTLRVFDDIVVAADKQASKARVAPDETVRATWGRTLLKKIEGAWSMKKYHGQQLGNAVKNQADDPVGYYVARQTMKEAMENTGAVLLPDNTWDLTGTRWVDDAGAQKVIETLWGEVGDGGVRTAQQAHVFTQRLDTIMPSRTTINNNMWQSLKYVVDQVDNSVTTSLDDVVAGYAQNRIPYARATQAIAAADDLLGTKFINSPDVVRAIRAGEVSNRLISNVQGRPMSVVQALDEVTGDYGGSLMDQVTFGALVEDAWSLTPERSFRGQIQKANVTAAAEVVFGGKVGLIRALRNMLQSDAPDMLQQRAIIRELVKSLLR